MSSPTGTDYPGAIDTSTLLAVTPGAAIASANANTQSSAILALETAMGPNPGLVNWKKTARLATAAALPSNSYSGTPQTLTASANGALTIDSVTPLAQDRVLVKNESTQTHNGVYVVTDPGGPSAPYVLTRAQDYNASADILAAQVVPVSEGGVNAATAWMLTTPGSIVLDTNNLTYAAVVGNAAGSGPMGGQGGGSANAYTLTLAAPPSAYAAGQTFMFVSPFANTSSATLNVNGLGAKALTKFGATAVASGDILSGAVVEVVYDGTEFQLISTGAVMPVVDGGTGLDSFAKGDLLAATGSTTLLAVTVGSNGTVLTANSAQSAGLDWADGTVGVESGGTLTSTEPNLNFINGTHISISVTDNAGSSRADVTINNTGSGTIGGRYVFLDGSDGSITFDGTSTVLGMAPTSSTYTLSRNIMPSSMTVNSGVTINPNGFLIFVQQTLTNNGTIEMNGNSGSGATAGTGFNYTTLNCFLTVSSGAGGAGGSTSGGSGGIVTGFGGAGGAGGNGHGAGNTGGVGGVMGTPNGGLASARMWGIWLYGGNFSTGPATSNGGSGGGGGAGDGTNSGGGGGAGGGWVIISARDMFGTGTISANGGNGANGSAGNTGGGGGGGGGAVSLFYEYLAGTLTVQANGGTAGTASGSGSNGVAGHAGNVFTLSCF